MIQECKKGSNYSYAVKGGSLNSPKRYIYKYIINGHQLNDSAADALLESRGY